MLIPNHPHDERLSALASRDSEAVADSALSEHVASCARCTDTVAELGALRASLAELPDVRPHRPLQLLPPVTDAPASRVDRVGGWARRFFAPVLTAGAALAMVGLVGTTAPLLGGMASSQGTFENVGSELDAAAPGAQELRSAETSDAPAALEGAGGERQSGDAASPGAELFQDDHAEEPSGGDSDRGREALVEERSIWPMVLFTGVAIMIAAALLRWILAPRPG